MQRGTGDTMTYQNQFFLKLCLMRSSLTWTRKFITCLCQRMTIYPLHYSIPFSNSTVVVGFYSLSCEKLLHVIMLWPIKCRPKYSWHSLLNCLNREQLLALCSLLFPSSYSGPNTTSWWKRLQPHLGSWKQDGYKEQNPGIRQEWCEGYTHRDSFVRKQTVHFQSTTLREILLHRVTLNPTEYFNCANFCSFFNYWARKDFSIQTCQLSHVVGIFNFISDIFKLIFSEILMKWVIIYG